MHNNSNKGLEKENLLGSRQSNERLVAEAVVTGPEGLCCGTHMRVDYCLGRWTIAFGAILSVVLLVIVETSKGNPATWLSPKSVVGHSQVGDYGQEDKYEDTTYPESEIDPDEAL